MGNGGAQTSAACHRGGGCGCGLTQRDCGQSAWYARGAGASPKPRHFALRPLTPCAHVLCSCQLNVCSTRCTWVAICNNHPNRNGITVKTTLTTQRFACAASQVATSISGSDTIRKKRRVTPTLSVSMRDFDAPPASTAYQYIEEHYRDTLQAQEHLYSSLWRCLSSSMVTSWRPIRDLAGLPQLARRGANGGF